MSPSSANQSPEPSGALVLVVGPSGAGKDTLLNAAKQRFRADSRFAFPERTITRPSMPTAEEHATLTPEEFEKHRSAGGFGLSWTAHGLAYGIAVEDIMRVYNGTTVVVNVSRSVVRTAELLCDFVTVLHVTAPIPILAARIAGRGRESHGDIEARLSREAAIVSTRADVVDILNDRDVSVAAEQFCSELEAAHVSAMSRRE